MPDEDIDRQIAQLLQQLTNPALSNESIWKIERKLRILRALKE